MKVVSHLVKFVRYLPRLLFDLMLTFSASAYVVVVFLIKEKTTLPFILNCAPSSRQRNN